MSLKILSGSYNKELSEKISTHLNISLVNRVIKKFKDGEIYVQITENVRGDDVFVVQSICHPVNDALMELLILIDALKRASASRITAVITYYGYARQDRKAEAREPITAKLVADLLTTAGASRILTIDLHVPQIQGFFNIPVDEVSLIPLFSKYILEKNLSDMVVVAPDAGATKKARSLAKRLNNCPIAIIDKRRSAHNVSEVVNIVGDVNGKTAILLDDIIDTGGSISGAANELSKHCKEVFICASHAVFSNGCIDKLNSCNVSEVIVSDTIPLVPCGKIKVVSIAEFLSDVINNIHNHRSVSELF